VRRALPRQPRVQVRQPGAGTHPTPPALASPAGISLTVSGDQKFASFTSVWGIDAVLVKGGDDENAYVYNPPSNGDESCVRRTTRPATTRRSAT
jgi:hypothetical protein